MRIQTCLVLCCGWLLTACGASSPSDDMSGLENPATVAELGTSPITTVVTTATTALNVDRRCDTAPYPSVQWTACEAANYAKALGGPAEQVTNPAFVQRWLTQSLTNLLSYLARSAVDPSWLLASTPLLGVLTEPAALAAQLQALVASLQADPSSAARLPLNTPVTPLCATWSLQCAGDPFLFPNAKGPDGAAFYTDEASVTPVVFYDRDCARLSGRVWMPTGAGNRRVPAVVFTNGSVQAPETAYWWLAQALVRAGYAVMTYDPRGQGRSDLQTPAFQQGSNFNPKVFWEGQVDAIDFFRSSPQRPYPHQQRCEGTYPTETTAFNPIWQQLDPDRLGIAGHSLGAIGVSVVQGYGAPGADPWPGLIDSVNPVKAAIAYDSLLAPDGSGLSTLANLPIPPGLAVALTQLAALGGLPAFAPQVPAMSFNADYAFAPVPYLLPPPADAHRSTIKLWQQAGVPTYGITLQGTTHFDFSLLPSFPASSWCADTSSGACRGGWGRPAITAYSLAWFDRWLKLPGEPGHADADQRLLDDASPDAVAKLSFRYQSARDFPDRSGARQRCDDIRAGCN